MKGFARYSSTLLLNVALGVVVMAPLFLLVEGGDLSDAVVRSVLAAVPVSVIALLAFSETPGTRLARWIKTAAGGGRRRRS